MSPGPTPVSPAFRSVLTTAGKGLVVKPLLHSYFLEGKFPDHFSVSFRKHALDHGPDGWFHPSTHPMWTERQLWYYINHPESFIAEGRDYMGQLSITMGTAVGAFVEMCLYECGVLVRREGPCQCGDPECIEWYAEDLETRSRGHMDGQMELDIPGYPLLTRQVFEMKSITERAKLPPEDLCLDWLIEKKPTYWAQQQEYMRLTGIRLSVLLFLSMGYPWEMREIHIPYSDKFAFDVAQKYRRVRESQQLPLSCCNPGSKQSKACAFRGVCPVALGKFT